MRALLISQESGEIHTLPSRGEFLVGRETGACIDMLNIDSDEISRKHAIIKSSQDGTNYHIEDNLSKNGTFINGMLIQRGTLSELASGDIIRFSTLNYQFKLEIDDNEPKTVINNVITGEFNDRKKRIVDYCRDDVSLFQIKMLKYNRELSFLKIDYLLIDDTYRLYYDIEGHMLLKQFMAEGFQSESDIYRIFYNIVTAIRSMDALYIKPMNLSLTVDSIYINPINLSIRLMFVPALNRNLDVCKSLHSLVNDFKIYNKTDETPDFSSLEDILKEGCGGFTALADALQEQEKRARQLEMTERRYLPVREFKEEIIAQPVKEVDEALPTLKLLAGMTMKQRGYASQVFLILALIVLFFSGMLKIMDYIGFCIVVLGVDLWLLKSFRFI